MPKVCHRRARYKSAFFTTVKKARAALGLPAWLNAVVGVVRSLTVLLYSKLSGVCLLDNNARLAGVSKCR